jgi:hypothetical protein
VDKTRHYSTNGKTGVYKECIQGKQGKIELSSGESSKTKQKREKTRIKAQPTRCGLSPLCEESLRGFKEERMSCPKAGDESSHWCNARRTNMLSKDKDTAR